MVLSPIRQGLIVLIVQVIHSSIVLKQIQLSLNYPNNSTQWHLQMFLTYLLLSFIYHHLLKLISFSSNLIKKFFMILEHLPVEPSCMLTIERFNRNHHNQSMSIETTYYKWVIIVSLIRTHLCIILTNSVTTKVAIPKLKGHHFLSSWYITLL
jgi:hypothetical protein